MENTPRAKSYAADIHDKVARIYYSHGLFCSSHPYWMIFITLGTFIICCYPLIHLPLLGSSSQQFSSSVKEFVAPDIVLENSDSYTFTGPRWFQGPPVSYVQHIVVKTALSPWKSDLILTDAFRAPLSNAFVIHELLTNHQINIGTPNHTSFSDLCLQVSEPIDKQTLNVLPHYGCLILSPSNIWSNNLDKFKDDPDIIKTIFSQKDSSVDSSILREILFGVPFKETGIKKLFVRNRPRIITFSVTVAFRTYNAKFLQSLSNHLRSKFPNDPYPENATYSFESGDIVHMHFQDLHTFIEFVPLCIAYVILFLYIYFSVYKIELVKSKWALAISAVMTVMMSLFMSVGLCLWFGLNPTLSGSEILPYLIVVIGLENMLVLTKSVVSTPMHLDVKLRVAQGLSKEGWSITKNLLTELALLMLAFLTFVPKIQEFSLFAVVGLLSDFFLQLVFFATFLSVDIRRMEVTDLQRNCIREVSGLRSNQSRLNGIHHPQKIPEPRLLSVNVGSSKSSIPSNKIIAPPATQMLRKLPKRMKFIYFWARTRMVQRGLMVCLVMWIVLLVYSSGIIEKYTKTTSIVSSQVLSPLLSSISQKFNSTIHPTIEEPKKVEWNCTEQIASELSRNIDLRLKHINLNTWQYLHSQHWMNLFGYYNISLSGRYISILPPMHISVTVNPEIAVELRNPKDFDISRKSYWKFLSSGELRNGDIDELLSRDLPYHPSSPAEVAIAIALAIPSLLFLIYLMVVLYRCMCSKHYAEWRTSWKNTAGSEVYRNGYLDEASDANLVMETFPLKLNGHSQELEFISSDSNIIISSCLDGNINVWDSLSGECVTSIKRSRISEKPRKPLKSPGYNSSFSSDSTYSSSPQSDNGDMNYLYNSVSSPQDQRSPNVADSLFPKHFTFENYSPCHQSNVECQKKYDFERFVLREDKPHTNISHECTNSHSVVHEYLKTSILSCEFVEKGTKVVHSTLSPQAVWSLDHYGSYIAVGCKDGRVEIWNAFTGCLGYVYEECKSGVTTLCLTSDRLITARVNGLLDFFALDIVMSEKSQATCLHDEKGNLEQGGSSSEVFHCHWLQSIKAHSLTISALEVDNGLVISGGYDRLVKVLRSDSAICIYTLHGHTSPISVLNIDQFSPSSAVSGCQDGLICLWDLMTGTCMYSISGHCGTVTSLLSTDIYLISQGADNHICIWEKNQGHLLHSISQDFNLHCNFILLTNNIMVTAKEDNLVLWDVNHGEALRMIMVGKGDHSIHVQMLRLSGQSVVCDYGPQIFIINFPAISDKSE